MKQHFFITYWKVERTNVESLDHTENELVHLGQQVGIDINT